MKLRNVRLTLANIAPTTGAKSLIANEAMEIKEKGVDGSIIDKVIGYSVTCTARRDTITIKFPPEVKPQWEELKELLEEDAQVEISFEGLKLTPYALRTESGNVLSGVSAKASSFQIVRSSKEEILEEIDL